MIDKQLIYKDDARRAILKANPSIAYCIDNIKPVDAVKVIRCINCRYYNIEQSECNIKFDSDGEKLLMPPDAYCSDGKRRKNEFGGLI